MRLRRAHVDDGHSAVVNVTPLIDVVMCLIIFYLLVGKLAFDQRVKLALPESGAGITQIEATVAQVELPADERDGPVILNGERLTVASLTERLREKVARDPGVAVQLRADRDLPFARVAPVLEACREAGLTTVRLATRRAAGAVGSGAAGGDGR